MINKDPEGEGGWIAKIEIGDAGRKEFDTKGSSGGEEGAVDLMTVDEYAKFTAE